MEKLSVFAYGVPTKKYAETTPSMDVVGNFEFIF
jgi:hypothetical protein